MLFIVIQLKAVGQPKGLPLLLFFKVLPLLWMPGLTSINQIVLFLTRTPWC